MGPSKSLCESRSITLTLLNAAGSDPAKKLRERSTHARSTVQSAVRRKVSERLPVKLLTPAMNLLRRIIAWMPLHGSIPVK
eukprot:3373303-Amphidinium_carterae.1